MDRTSRFSYACHQCGLCCHDQVISLSPYDVIRIARASGITTAEAVARYTVRRGSILKFGRGGECVALAGSRCSIHHGRPLACRLYPLGLERGPKASAKFTKLEPATGSAGVYGEDGSVAEFLSAQGVDDYLAMNARYAALIGMMRSRVSVLIDFEKTDQREFWRCAVREALAEADYDPNPLIDAIFDPDGVACLRDSHEATVSAHVRQLEMMLVAEQDPGCLAAAAITLAVSLGYSPGDVVNPDTLFGI